jgi:hypothetical protein
LIQDPRGDLRHAFRNSDGRDMKQIDCEDNIVAICLGVRPSLRLGEVYVDGVPDIGIGVLGLQALRGQWSITDCTLDMRHSI